MSARIFICLILVFALSSCATDSPPAASDIIYRPAFPHLSFIRPVDLQAAPEGTNRLFVVEQAGRIYAFSNSPDSRDRSLFLDITDRVNDQGNEEGLLGLAFHPRFSQNGYFYVDYTAANPRRTIIARYSVQSGNPQTADPGSEWIILEIPQPYGNHNGGQIAFGPDGYLYIALGDGGSAGDPQGNGQNLKTLLGSILRIDVDRSSPGGNYEIPPDNPFVGNSEGFRPEIFAYGLRNPWRFSFDPVTGWLWTGDVGQNRIEEIDIIEKGKNYGWNIMEGSRIYSSASGNQPQNLVMPVWEYTHSVGQSVTGGFVYRGKRIPRLGGAYIYADYVSGKIWALRYDGTGAPENQLLFDTDLNISSFGIDRENELYFCAFDGKIYTFHPAE
ncbi:MAG: PQQ-dependent sugar dehydrogenase [Calditrichia bacterium]